MNNELKVSFYLKREGNTERTETNPDAVFPIIGKIIIGNTIAQFGSKLKIEERLWSVKSGRAIGKSRIAVELNREINKINLSIHTHYKDILKRTGKVTAIEVKNAFQGIATAQKTLLVLFGEMMGDFKGRIGIDRAQSTYKQYEVLYKQLKQFLREEYHVEDIPLTELDLPFIEALNFFFRVKRKMKPRTVKARIVLLNKVIRLALHRKIITRPPFDGFELEKTELKNKSLTEDDGSLWISANRQKSHTEFNVKLLNIPIHIMEYYKGLASDGKVFPHMSLGQVNVGLKRIARNCGINRVLSYHMARYTFASQICLSQGVPIESVSRMLGHKHIETTQRYARLNNEKIGNDMQQLSARLATKFNF